MLATATGLGTLLAGLGSLRPACAGPAPPRPSPISRRRLFPRGALLASALAHCGGPDRFFGFLNALFRSQSSWAQSDDVIAALVRIGRLGGLTTADMEACFKDKALIDRILASRVEGARDFEIASTPTFIINGEKVVGALPYEQFEAIFERLL